jgi:hypothetical protein
MWKQIQKMLATYQESVSIGSPAQHLISHINQQPTLLSLATASPARPLPNENEHPGPKSNKETSSHDEVSITYIELEDGNNDTISQSQSSCGENLGNEELVKQNTNSLLVINLNSYNSSIAGMFSCVFDPT